MIFTVLMEADYSARSITDPSAMLVNLSAVLAIVAGALWVHYVTGDKENRKSRRLDYAAMMTGATMLCYGAGSVLRWL